MSFFSNLFLGSPKSKLAAHQFPEYPGPMEITTEEQLDAVLDEVGALQQAMEIRQQFDDSTPNEIISRVEGSIIYLLKSCDAPERVFDTFIVPLWQWGLHLEGRHPDFVKNPHSHGQQVRQHMFDLCRDLMTRYAHLKPRTS